MCDGLAMGGNCRGCITVLLDWIFGRSRNECIPCNLEFIYFDQIQIDYLKFMPRHMFWLKHGIWNSLNIIFLVDIFMLCMCEHVSVFSIAETCHINIENHVGVGKHVSM